MFTLYRIELDEIDYGQKRVLVTAPDAVAAVTRAKLFVDKEYPAGKWFTEDCEVICTTGDDVEDWA